MPSDIDDIVIAQHTREQVNDLLVKLLGAVPADLVEVSDIEFPLFMRGFASGFEAGLQRGKKEERESGPAAPAPIQFSTASDRRGEITAAEAKRLVDQSERAQRNRNFEHDPLLS